MPENEAPKPPVKKVAAVTETTEQEEQPNLAERTAHKVRSRFAAVTNNQDVRTAARRAAPWLVIAGAAAVPAVGLPVAGAAAGKWIYDQDRKAEKRRRQEQEQAKA